MTTKLAGQKLLKGMLWTEDEDSCNHEDMGKHKS
jgi:hypothetical protein